MFYIEEDIVTFCFQKGYFLLSAFVFTASALVIVVEHEDTHVKVSPA